MAVTSTDSEIPACDANQTTITRYTMPAVVALAPRKTMPTVAANATRIAPSQRAISAECLRNPAMICTGISPPESYPGAMV